MMKKIGFVFLFVAFLSPISHASDASEECVSLGYEWGSTCIGNGNYGVWHTGCLVDPGTGSCPEGWDYSLQNQTTKVCSKTAFGSGQPDPSGC